MQASSISKSLFWLLLFLQQRLTPGLYHSQKAFSKQSPSDPLKAKMVGTCYCVQWSPLFSFSTWLYKGCNTSQCRWLLQGSLLHKPHFSSEGQILSPFTVVLLLKREAGFEGQRQVQQSSSVHPSSWWSYIHRTSIHYQSASKMEFPSHGKF